MRDTRRFAGGALALGLALVIGAGSSALADTERGHHGAVGVHYLRDSYRDAGHYYAGAECTYADDADTMTVLPPVVLARDKTTHEDYQRVGWRARLQRKGADGSWTTVRLRHFQYSWSSDRLPADFGQRQSFAINRDHRFKVLVDMRWYSDDAFVGKPTHVVGRATHEVDVYLREIVHDELAFTDAFLNSCAY